MLLDFTQLKGSLREVCKKLDHTNLNDLEVFMQNPSAERIAMYIYNQIVSDLRSKGIDLSYQEGKEDAWLYAVDVFETDTSRARYTIC
jgi:6-pyruvoyltetrahydropterin/6-carboxytetrahydropterin synthase